MYRSQLDLTLDESEEDEEIGPESSEETDSFEDMDSTRSESEYVMEKSLLRTKEDAEPELPTKSKPTCESKETALDIETEVVDIKEEFIVLTF